MRIFHPDSPLVRFLEKIGNLIILNIVFLLCCLPIITIGPAITAVYWVTLKLVRNEEGGIIQDFLHSFRTNFKQGIVVGLIMFAVGAFILLELYWMFQIAQFGAWFDKFMFAFMIFVAAVYLMTSTYVWSLLAKFNNSTKQLLRTSVALAVNHILATIVMGVIAAIPIILLLTTLAYVALTLMFLFVIGIPAIAYIQSTLLVKIFDQYLPAEPEESDEQ